MSSEARVRPYFCTSPSTAPRTESRSRSTGEVFSAQFDISAACGLKHLRVSLERIRPGARMAPAHAHHTREEGLVLLAGSATAIVGDERIELRPGDVCVFLPGEAALHTVVNTASVDAELLVFADNPPDDAVKLD